MMHHTAPGDIGRRVSARRTELGLSREALAERAGMDPGYIEYLEGRPATPTTDALNRLASALETTSECLLGGETGQPPGRGAAAPHSELRELGTEECLRLIAPGGIGRVGFDGPDGPTVLPVNYRIHGGSVLIRTAFGGPIEEGLRTGMEGVEIKVAFEVDRIDDAMRQGWSVLVQGPAHHVSSEEELAEVESAEVEAWAGGDRTHYIRIMPHRVTGRRVHAG
jgi:transcriptional regulator with XRE-family HTH domain